MAAYTLKGKTVVVIGGTSGMGYAVARAALADGARVVVGSSNVSNVTETVDRLGAGATGGAINVCEEADVAAFFERVGPFDHLAFTAGDWAPLFVPRPIAELDLAEIGSVFAVRFWGAITAIKHAARSIAEDGSITLTGGVVSRRPLKGESLTSAMIGAVEHLAQALAVDMAPVRVNVVSPGLIRTEVWNAIPADQREAQLREMTKQQPLPRVGESHEAAEAFLYAMRAGFTTGQVLTVDGGWTLV
jgi:NAD(P)-dependent dehydrogenase (short-subunit alcohol dehydrogenase family)